VFRERSWAFITGIGPGATGALTITYVYNLFTVAKVLLEYGIYPQQPARRPMPVQPIC
jgi:hypothetical protein